MTTPIGSGDAETHALVIQKDRRLVAAGYSIGKQSVFALARYMPDGSLDKSFGSGGKVQTPIGSGDAKSNALAIQKDGKLVAAGDTEAGVKHFALVRYMPDGSLDKSFGSGGKVTTPIGSGDAEINALAIQKDGKLVAAGYAIVGKGLGLENFTLVRYMPDGSLDKSFGSGGKVTTSFGDFEDDNPRALVIQKDGRLVAAEYSIGEQSAFTLARYMPDGSLDRNFGSGGKVQTPIGSSGALAFALAIQKDGKLVAAGGTAKGKTDFELVRYMPNGSLDKSFGPGGKVTTAFGRDGDALAFSLAIQPDRKLVAAGWKSPPAPTSKTDFALVRYMPDGSLDKSFGLAGKVTAAIGPNGDALARALAIQKDGKLVAAGYAKNGSKEHFALVRYR